MSGTVTRSGRWDGTCESVHYSDGRAARYYSFTLSESALVTIDLTSPSVDTWLALRYGSGTGSGLIEEDDDDGGGFNARITRRLAGGTYTIEATPFGGFFAGSETGSFTLTLEVGPATQTDTTPPSLVSADVWEHGDALTLEFDENMDFPIGGSLLDMLSITADGAPVFVAGDTAQIPGASVTLAWFTPVITRMARPCRDAEGGVTCSCRRRLSTTGGTPSGGAGSSEWEY